MSACRTSFRDFKPGLRSGGNDARGRRMDFDLIREVVVPNETKIVLLVMDGLGGLPHPGTRRTELETANIPHLDRLAEEGVCGLVQHVGGGITPGSGPGHLSLFGSG